MVVARCHLSLKRMAGLIDDVACDFLPNLALDASGSAINVLPRLLDNALNLTSRFINNIVAFAFGFCFRLSTQGCQVRRETTETPFDLAHPSVGVFLGLRGTLQSGTNFLLSGPEKFRGRLLQEVADKSQKHSEIGPSENNWPNTLFLRSSAGGPF